MNSVEQLKREIAQVNLQMAKKDEILNSSKEEKDQELDRLA